MQHPGDILWDAQRIKNTIHEHPIVVFMKGTAEQPYCGFSGKVAMILQHLQVPFVTFNVLENEDLRQNLKTFSDWQTFPQVYANGIFIGGCDIICDLQQRGELQTLLENALAQHQSLKQS